MATLRDRLIQLVWRRAERLGVRGRRTWVSIWGSTIGRLPLPGLRQWANNVELALGYRPSRLQLRQAAGYWLRNSLDSITLVNWTGDEIAQAVTISDEDWARLESAHKGPGAVLALGHLGSWDLCGAWVCQKGMPVTSVAEHLVDARYEEFLRAREALGMRIHTLGESDIFEKLVQDFSQGRLICLLSDKALGRTGVDVYWPNSPGNQRVRVPAGPALLARRTGATLFVVTSHYEGNRLRIRVSEPIAHRNGRDGLVAMMQDVFDQISGAVQLSPVGWHTFGPYFSR